jgi:hypothetical protein
MHSLVLLLEVKLATIDKPEIMFESVFEGDETTMLMWFVVLGIGHYH